MLLICIPDFDVTHSCVLVNLRSLDCNEIKFATSMDTMPLSTLRGQGVEGEDEFDLPVPEEEDMSILNQMDDEDDFED